MDNEEITLPLGDDGHDSRVICPKDVILTLEASDAMVPLKVSHRTTGRRRYLKINLIPNAAQVFRDMYRRASID